MGVKSNHSKISFGGGLLRALLSEGHYICSYYHPNATGGPWTRVDPANPETKSCLDLVIISSDLLPFFLSLTIDPDRKYMSQDILIIFLSLWNSGTSQGGDRQGSIKNLLLFGTLKKKVGGMLSKKQLKNLV